MKKTTQIDQLIERWREMGPVAWAESEYGWIGLDGAPITLAPWQRALLESWWTHREEISTLAISNIKKTGKTLLNAVILAWRWLAMPGVHFTVANDLDQSTARQFAEVGDMCKRHPFLSQNVKAGVRALEFIPTGSTLQALAGDASGNAGANQLTVSHTETWGVIYEQDIRNYEELTNPPGRFYGLPTLRVADSYAGWLEESQVWHDLVDRGLAGERLAGEWPIFIEGGLMLFHAEGEWAQRHCFRGTPEEAAQYYRDQRATLRENAFKRLHENVRTVNIGTFIDQDDWEALLDPEHKPGQVPRGRAVYVGLDLAVSAGGDNCALIGVYYDKGKVRVAFHKVWKGGKLRLKKLKLTETVQPYIEELNERYSIEAVYFDPWQAIHLAEVLQDKGIRCIEVKQTHSSRGPKDTALYEIASSGNLVLYDHDELRYATAGASAKELGNGMIFLQKAGGRSKIDLLIALSNCADVCWGQGEMPNLGWVPDPYYDGADAVYMPDFGWWASPRAALDWYVQTDTSAYKHPPGVTAANCKKGKNGICPACIQEWKEAGEYERQEKERVAARHEARNRRDQADIQQPTFYTQEEMKQDAARKAVQMRMNQIRKNLRGDQNV